MLLADGNGVLGKVGDSIQGAVGIRLQQKDGVYRKLVTLGPADGWMIVIAKSHNPMRR